MLVRNLTLLIICLCVGCAGKKASETPDETTASTSQKTTETTGTMQKEVLAEEVTFEVKGLVIHGTITRPDGEGPFPAIAIAAGSGPTDRDWLNPMLPGENGSAKLLAEELADEGIVVLRYDKRGIGATGMPSTPVTWGDYVADLDAALSLLHAQDFVDRDRIFVAGHSEGGAHAIRAAAQTETDLAGVILLSTAARTLRDIVLWQIGAQIKASGLNPSAQAMEMSALEKALDAIAAGKTVDAAKVGQLPGVQQFIAALQNPSSVDFARGLLTFDPATAFEAFDAPVLVLSGTKDIQVDTELDAKPLAEAAKAAGNSTTLAIIEDADHVLKHEQTPRDEITPQLAVNYNAKGRVLAPEVVPTITAFVATRLED